MAPVEIDHIPRSFSIENLNLKSVEKALELPLVNSAYTEVTRMASPITPYVESTLTKVTPMVEAGYQTLKTQVEEKVVPHIPTNISESVSKNVSATLDSVTAAVEKADCYACCGIEQLTEKLPQLKEATPQVLLEETKENVSSYITAATDYTASFSLAQLALKVVDVGLTAVEGILNKAGKDEECGMVAGVRKVHSTANTIRLSAVKKAGTEKAKKIEEGSILEAVLFLLGIPELMESLGLKLTKTKGETETVYEDEVSRVEVEKHKDAEEPVVVDTAATEKVEEPKELVVVDTKEVEESVVVDAKEVEDPVVVDTKVDEDPVVVDTADNEEVKEPVVVDTEKVEDPLVVDNAGNDVEEAVEVDPAYPENEGNVLVDSDSEYFYG